MDYLELIAEQMTRGAFGNFFFPKHFIEGKSTPLNPERGNMLKVLKKKTRNPNIAPKYMFKAQMDSTVVNNSYLKTNYMLVLKGSDWWDTLAVIAGLQEYVGIYLDGEIIGECLRSDFKLPIVPSYSDAPKELLDSAETLFRQKLNRNVT